MTWTLQQENKITATLAILADKAGIGGGELTPDLETDPDLGVDFLTDAVIAEHLSAKRKDAKDAADAKTAEGDTASRDAEARQQQRIDDAVASALAKRDAEAKVPSGETTNPQPLAPGDAGAPGSNVGAPSGGDGVPF